MKTATLPHLFWHSTRDAIYLRGPSPEPRLPHGGPLYGYAVRLTDGNWKVVDRTGARTETTVAYRLAAREALERIAAAHREAA